MLPANFFKTYKNGKRPELIEGRFWRKYFDNTGKVVHQQAVDPEECMRDIFDTLHEDIMQGHPGSKKMLYNLRKHYYYPDIADKVQEFINNCQTCFRLKLIAKEDLGPLLQKIYIPKRGPEDLLEVD